MMNNQEQNWTNLWGSIPPEGISWHGTWIRYTPDQEVLTSFQGVRSFVPSQDNRVITHTNNYTYTDGSTEEKQWHIEKISCNRPDGTIHPASAAGRALSLGDGATVWISKNLETGKFFGGELFFQHQEWRTSVAMVYAGGSDLTGIAQVREHQGGFSERSLFSKDANLSGNWTGTKQSMTGDLSISAAEEIEGLELDPTEGKNETLFLDDGIIINCPKKVRLGLEIELVAGKLVAENKYKRLTVKYDKTGTFSQLISEVFNRQS